ncbi:hypothetical protein [Deinococcus rufus]|uniref:DUF1877 family protein n=1 Tax=Deinococcus rufus TaxID=2136097 RepID=A0ABV7Z8Q3_9DEIO
MSGYLPSDVVADRAEALLAELVGAQALASDPAVWLASQPLPARALLQLDAFERVASSGGGLHLWASCPRPGLGAAFTWLEGAVLGHELVLVREVRALVELALQPGTAADRYTLSERYWELADDFQPVYERAAVEALGGAVVVAS